MAFEITCACWIFSGCFPWFLLAMLKKGPLLHWFPVSNPGFERGNDPQANPNACISRVICALFAAYFAVLREALQRFSNGLGPSSRLAKGILWAFLALAKAFLVSRSCCEDIHYSGWNESVFGSKHRRASYQWKSWGLKVRVCACSTWNSGIIWQLCLGCLAQLPMFSFGKWKDGSYRSGHGRVAWRSRCVVTEVRYRSGRATKIYFLDKLKDLEATGESADRAIIEVIHVPWWH